MPKKPLNQQLFDEPYRFEFFQAVRLLERIYPEKSPIGEGVTPNNEVVRFKNHLSLGFPASQIQAIKEEENQFTEQSEVEMFVNFMGMLGIVGVLPIHYTELAMNRARYGDHTFASFMDIFTHRAVSLFFKAWEKYRFPVQYERGNDSFTEYLFDFVGIGTAGLHGRMDLDDESLLPYSGLIAQKPHSSGALSQILSDYYGVEVKIKQFFGQWLDLEEESLTRIGKANCSLGLNTIVGTRVWDFQSNFRVVLGPLKFIQFQSFLPKGTAYKPMISIIKFMIGHEQEYDVQLKLLAKEVPSCILTTRAVRKPMLGWTTWLKTRSFTENDEQVVMQIEA